MPHMSFYPYSNFIRACSFLSPLCVLYRRLERVPGVARRKFDHNRHVFGDSKAEFDLSLCIALFLNFPPSDLKKSYLSSV